MVEEGFVSYKLGMLLRKAGFNERCSTYYCNDVTHNGKSIGFEEELDLKLAGREKEIKYIRGGNVGHDSASNTDEWIGKYDCSRPTYDFANRWLREVHHYYLMPQPRPFNKWVTSVIVLGKPNLHDFLLNAVHLYEKSFPTYDEAMEYGLTFIVKTIVGTGKRLARGINREKVEEIKKELKEKGFDI